MHEIRLSRASWQYDQMAPLGSPGGFGAVYRGISPEGEPVAVKRLHFSAQKSAARELRIAESLISRDLSHVIPYLDFGLDERTSSYFLVMPIAEMSLADHVLQSGPLTEKETTAILHSIAVGLSEVGDLVHRDLKPSNILLEAEQWKIADFGIARFVEESTSLQTLQGCLSPPYAAPEQWNLRRATQATDVYALGVTAYELLGSRLPFPGPSPEEFREQHLHSAPPPLASTDPRLAAVTLAMLRKAPEARPSLARVRELLEEILNASEAQSPAGPGLSALATAGSAELEKALAAEAASAAAMDAQAVRLHLAEEATTSLIELARNFQIAIQQAAISAKISHRHQVLLQVDLGAATLELAFLPVPTPISKDAFARSGWDVVASATVAVKQTTPTEYVWSANLWYTDLGRASGFRWWEVAYMSSPLLRSQRKYQPFALLELEDADEASAPGIASMQLAAKPKPIDAEYFAEFCDRWAGRLAEAFNGRLQHPSRLPLD